MDIKDISEWVALGRNLFNLFDSAKHLVPRGYKREQIELLLREAEELRQKSELSLAKQLDYRLCRCSFPPQIMLLNAMEGKWHCSGCGNEEAVDPERDNFDHEKWISSRFKRFKTNIDTG